MYIRYVYLVEGSKDGPIGIYGRSFDAVKAAANYYSAGLNIEQLQAFAREVRQGGTTTITQIGPYKSMWAAATVTKWPVI